MKKALLLIIVAMSNVCFSEDVIQGDRNNQRNNQRNHQQQGPNRKERRNQSRNRPSFDQNTTMPKDHQYLPQFTGKGTKGPITPRKRK